MTHPHGLYVFKPGPPSLLQAGQDFQSVRLSARPSIPEKALPERPGELVDWTGMEIFTGDAGNIIAVHQHSNGQIWLAAHDRLVLFDGQHFPLLH